MTPSQQQAVDAASKVAQSVSTADGFGDFTPGIGVANQNPAQTDPTPGLFSSAATSGIGIKDLGSLLPSTQQGNQDTLAQQYGYKDFNDFTSKVFAPSTSTQQLYNDAYKAAGLDAIKGKIEQRRTDLNTAVGAINDNPWLSEASRSGKYRDLQALADGDINQYQQLYDSGLTHVSDLVGREATDLHDNQALRASQLNFLEQQAANKAAQDQQAQVSKYLPDYLSALPKDAPKTVDVNGIPYVWDGKQFAPIRGVAPKPISLSEGETLYDPTTGKAIYTAPKTYAPGTGQPSKTEIAAAQMEVDRQAAQTAIDSRVGTDGFLSGSDYEKFAQAWARAGYGDFDKQFGAFKSPNTN